MDENIMRDLSAAQEQLIGREMCDDDPRQMSAGNMWRLVSLGCRYIAMGLLLELQEAVCKKKKKRFGRPSGYRLEALRPSDSSRLKKNIHCFCLVYLIKNGSK